MSIETENECSGYDNTWVNECSDEEYWIKTNRQETALGVASVEDNMKVMLIESQ